MTQFRTTEDSMDPVLRLFIEENRREIGELRTAIKDKFSEMDLDIKDLKVSVIGLYKFRWKVEGAYILISSIFGVVMAIITVMVTAK